MSKKKTLSHLAMLIFNNPLMILPSKLDVILSVIGGRIGLNDQEIEVELSSTEMAKARKPISTDKIEIGVVPIIGSLVHRSMGMDSYSGLRTYQSIREDFRQALNDSSTNVILLDIDSPGGEVAGVFDLAEEIYAARGKKPIYAFANESAYSAAYLIASAADKIWLPRTGGVGSIGVRMQHLDQSEWDKKEGLKFTSLYVGDRKMDFDPHSPLGKEAQEGAMSDLREIYSMFTGAVAKYRVIDESKVRSTEAGLFQGQNAVDAGLADQVMTFEEAIQTIAEDVAINKNLKKAKRHKPLANIKKEVKGMYESLAQMKEEAPELYQSLVEEAMGKARSDLQATFDNEKKGLETKIQALSEEVKSQEDRILKNEKAEFIRTNREIKARIDSAAGLVWTKALAGSDIPEDMHEKVRSMVKSDNFIKGEKDDRELDEQAFEEAVNAEISDWEDRGMKVSILGTGYGTKSGDDINVETKKKEEAADEEWVDHMLSLAGQVKKGGE